MSVFFPDATSARALLRPWHSRDKVLVHGIADQSHIMTPGRARIGGSKHACIRPEPDDGDRVGPRRAVRRLRRNSFSQAVSRCSGGEKSSYGKRTDRFSLNTRLPARDSCEIWVSLRSTLVAGPEP